MSLAAADRRIRALRPPKPAVDPWTAHGTIVEEERRPDGTTERALTVFLAGAECPFTCSFCDLWRYTIDGPTPVGALPRQLAAELTRAGGAVGYGINRSHRATEAVGGGVATADSLCGSVTPVNTTADSSTPPVSATLSRLKLYNASNFFDRRAVPAEDVPEIARLVQGFRGVTVESHVSTIGLATLDFARSIDGRLEVAVGLETIHPGAAARINKRLDIERFDRAAELLRANEIDLRVFVLLGAPHVPAAEQVEWTVRAVERAATSGAAVVSIIPVRGGNGEMERLAALGEFTPPTLLELEAALDACAHVTGTVVTADLWDAERLPGCDRCRGARIERLRLMNVRGGTPPRVACSECDAA